jgi:hypothetical protein
MKPAPFQYHAPRTVDETLELLAEYADDDGRVIAGGQSLVPMMAFRVAQPSLLVDLRKLPGLNEIKIGADGVRLGTVDKVEGERIKLTRADSGQGSHEGHHHYVPLGLVAGVEGDTVRLSANAAVAAELFTEEEAGTS